MKCNDWDLKPSAGDLKPIRRGCSMRHPSLHLFLIAMTIVLVTFGCTIYHKPRPFFDVPFQDRAQSKVDGEVRVTVAVLSAEESRQLFGVNLAVKDIQPVWVRVQNADSVPYWLMSAGLDPDYFSPLEAAYAFHGTIGSSVNKIMDDHFMVMNFRNPIAHLHENSVPVVLLLHKSPSVSPIFLAFFRIIEKADKCPGKALNIAMLNQGAGLAVDNKVRRCTLS